MTGVSLRAPAESHGWCNILNAAVNPITVLFQQFVNHVSDGETQERPQRSWPAKALNLSPICISLSISLSLKHKHFLLSLNISLSRNVYDVHVPKKQLIDFFPPVEKPQSDQIYWCWHLHVTNLDCAIVSWFIRVCKWSKRCIKKAICTWISSPGLHSPQNSVCNKTLLIPSLYTS